MRAKLSLALLLIFILLSFGCTDSGDTHGTSGPTQPGDQSYTITSLTADPSIMMAGGEVVVTAVVHKNGSLLQGETLAFTTNLGTFVEAGSASINKILENGSASVTLTSATSGDATVVVSIAGITAKIVVVFDEDVFFVTKIEPNSGSPLNGESVKISGAGFDEPVIVSFGGKFGEVTSISLMELTVSLPIFELPVPTQDLIVDVNVTRRAGSPLEESFAISQGFTFLHTVDIPDINGIDPVMGPNDGQTLVTIFGSGFGCPDIQVFFNDTPAAVQNCTYEEIVVLAPNAYDMGIENCNQDVTIKVRNLSWGTEGTYCCFHYGEQPIITAISQTSGLYTGGDIVTLYGHGFDEPVAVGLADVGAFVISVSETEVVVRSSFYDPQGDCSNNSGDVSLTNIECGASADGPDWEYIVPQVYLRGVINNTLGFPPFHVPPYPPNSGYQGHTVTLTGINFLDPMRVSFCDNETFATVTSDTTATATAPFFSDDFDTGACTVSGCEGEQEVPTACDVTVTNISTGCEDTVRNGFFYMPLFTVDTDGDTIPDEAECVVEPPVCGFDMTPSAPTAGNPVQFSDSSSNCVTGWAWDFGDTFTDNIQNPSHVYAVAGDYVVLLTVSNPGGSSACSQVITVNP